MKRYKVISKISIIFLLTLVSLGLLIPPKLALAGTPNTCNGGAQTFFGRYFCQTYYQNSDASNRTYAATPPDMVWSWPSGYSPTGATDDEKATNFINFMSAGLIGCGNHLQFCTPDGQTNAYANAVGNSMIINLMLGKNGPDFGTYSVAGANSTYDGMDYAINNFSTWSNRVRNYAALGRISWSISLTPASLANCTDKDGFSGRTDTLVSNFHGYGMDGYAYCNADGIAHNYMVFTNPDGTVFRINLLCGNVTGSISPLVDISIPPPPPILTPTISCSASVSNSLPEPSESITSTVTITSSSGTLAWTGGTASLDISPNGASGDGQTIPAPPILVPGDSESIPSSSISSGSLGPYSITWTVSGGNAPSTTCAISFRVVNKPFFKLSGGDISSGVSACSNLGWPYPNTGSLKSWNNGSSGSNQGAGTNLAAYARSQIDGFATSQTPSGSSPPKSLSFANNGGGVGTYGGLFGAGINCPTDYYSKHTGITSLPSNEVQDNSNSYDLTGTFTLNSATNRAVTSGNRNVIFVNGNVFIAHNITLSSGATIASLSNFYLVVKGNIYIAPGVDRLDGVYIAQPNGANTGRIYTCYGSGPGNAPTQSELNGTCKNTTLVVNGAFIAQELKLYRSKGSLSIGPPAEQFNYTTATWLAVPDALKDNSGGYDAITGLPPIL